MKTKTRGDRSILVTHIFDLDGVLDCDLIRYVIL